MHNRVQLDKVVLDRCAEPTLIRFSLVRVLLVRNIESIVGGFDNRQGHTMECNSVVECCADNAEGVSSNLTIPIVAFGQHKTLMGCFKTT